MRLLVIGGVAAGTSAAAKARRNSEEAEIVIYDKGPDISYAGCDTPYFIGGLIKDIDELTPRGVDFFKKRYNIDVKIRHEVTAIDPETRSLTVVNLENNETFTDHYDKLIIATGANSVIPPLPGVDQDHVFCLRTIRDAVKIDSFIKNNKVRSAAIVGSGSIGMEMTENLSRLGLEIHLIEMARHIYPAMDPDMSVHIEKHLDSHNIKSYKNTRVMKIEKDHLLTAEDEKIFADMVILATGVKPEVSLAKAAGIKLGETGAIAVDERMQTSNPDIYACGDCVEHFDLIRQKPAYYPLGSTANKTGRICGDAITGGSLTFRGVLGTGIFPVFDLSVARTGLNEYQAREEGYDIEIVHIIRPDKAASVGGENIIIKAVADRETEKLLGVQIVGKNGVDKRIDVLVTAMTLGAKVSDLFHLDLAYSPFHATAKDPVAYVGMVLDNAISKDKPILTTEKLEKLIKSNAKITIIDARLLDNYAKGHVEQAVNISHEEIRERLDELDKDIPVVAYCNRGTTGNAVQNILQNSGFKTVYTLSGGYQAYLSLHPELEELEASDFEDSSAADC